MVVSAEEYLDQDPGIRALNLKEDHPHLYRYIKENLLGFAELHRQECLKQASQKARKQHVCTGGASYYIVNKDSILNAYSKKNIR